MNRTKVLAGVAVLAVAALAWDRWGAARPDAAGAAPSQAGPTSGGGPGVGIAIGSAGYGPSSPGAGSAANFLRPAAAAKPTVSALARDFTNATQYKPLLDRLNGTPEGNTPEGQYYLYQILRACATVADRKGGSVASWRNAQLEERRDLIASEAGESEARKAQRLAAIEQLTADKCAGIAGISMTEAELNQLLRNSLAGGDPKARAWSVEQELWRERRAAGAEGRAGATLSEAQVASLRESLASKDPEALVIAGRVLANTFRDATVRLGPEQEPVDPRSFGAAALLLACEYGYPCGNNHPRVLNACAYQGQCGAATLADYLYFYGASPYEAQAIDRYRNVLRQSADSGDWSALVVQRGARSPNAPPPGWPPAR